MKIIVFKPRIDDRYSAIEIVSHSGIKVPCLVINKAEKVLKEIKADTQVVAGLDKDFREKLFGVMPQLLTRAEFVTKLTAVCTKCGAPATRTQRLVNGKPAFFNDSIVLVCAVEHYEPRCRHCHEIFDKPNKFE